MRRLDARKGQIFHNSWGYLGILVVLGENLEQVVVVVVEIAAVIGII